MQATFSWQIPADQTIRKITAPSGQTGGYHRRRLPGTTGSADGAGDAARFYFPAGVRAGRRGIFYVADFGNNNIRTERVVAPVLQLFIFTNQIIFPGRSPPVASFWKRAHDVAGTWIPQTNGIVISGDTLWLRTVRLMRRVLPVTSVVRSVSPAQPPLKTF